VEEIDSTERIVYLKRAKSGTGKVACHLSYPDEVGWVSPGSPVTLKGACEGRDPETSAVHVVGCQIINQ
jgi:hypothetical protein